LGSPSLGSPFGAPAATLHAWVSSDEVSIAAPHSTPAAELRAEAAEEVKLAGPKAAKRAGDEAIRAAGEATRAIAVAKDTAETLQKPAKEEASRAAGEASRAVGGATRAIACAKEAAGVCLEAIAANVIARPELIVTVSDAAVEIMGGLAGRYTRTTIEVGGTTRTAWKLTE
jgi:hypothetical protein